MKKSKLVSTICGLSALVSTTPIVATSCSDTNYQIVGNADTKSQANQFMIFKLQNSHGQAPADEVVWKTRVYDESKNEYVIDRNFWPDNDLALANGTCIVWINYMDTGLPEKLQYTVDATYGDSKAATFHGVIRPFKHYYWPNLQENADEEPYEVTGEELLTRRLKLYYENDDGTYVFNENTVWDTAVASANLNNRITMQSKDGVGSIAWSDPNKPVRIINNQWFTILAHITEDGETYDYYVEYYVSMRKFPYIAGPKNWFVGGNDCQMRFTYVPQGEIEEGEEPIEVKKGIEWTIEYGDSGLTENELAVVAPADEFISTKNACYLKWIQDPAVTKESYNITLVADPIDYGLPTRELHLTVHKYPGFPTINPAVGTITATTTEGKEFNLTLSNGKPALDPRWMVEIAVDSNGNQINDIKFSGNKLVCDKPISNAKVLVFCMFNDFYTYGENDWTTKKDIMIKVPYTVSFTE